MIIVNSNKSLDLAIEELRSEFEKSKYLTIEVKKGRTRTGSQNRALHKYCSMLAEVLNDQGLSFTMFFKEGYDVPWTMNIVKDNIWRPVQIAMTGKESTTEPQTVDYLKIYEIVNRKLSEFGIHVEWPSNGEDK